MALLAVVTIAIVACGSPAPKTILHSQSTPPTNGVAAYDEAHRVVVLVTPGASASSSTRMETWTWDGRIWTLQAPAVSPSVRDYAALAYDASRHVTVLEGGSARSPAKLNDTWEWNGSNWHERKPIHSPDPVQAGFSSMAYDPLTRQLLLYQWVQQTWIWDGKDWTQVPPAHVPNFQIGKLVFDGQRLLLLGYPTGGGRLDAWGWTGSDWTQVSTSHIGTTFVAFDAGHRNVVGLSGGPLDDTWIWNGSVWARQHPNHVPDGTLDPMVYDAALSRVIGFAGVGNAGITGIYAWDGSDWSALGSTTPPVVAPGKNLMATSDALALIRSSVTATHPVLLPQMPHGVNQALCAADTNRFDLTAMSDDRSIEITMGILVPGNSNLGATNKNIAFRGGTAFYQYIADDPISWRSLWWTERPGHWGDPNAIGMKGGEGVPYVLSASGLTESEFFALAGSLS